MSSLKVTVKEVYIPLGSIKVSGKGGTIHLRKFQEEVVFKIAEHRLIGVEAPTGSGKTFTLLSPLLSNVINGTSFSGVVGLYPTKALVEDQFASITDTLDRICERVEDTGSVIKYRCGLDVEWVMGGEVRRANYEQTLGVVKVTKEVLDKVLQSLEGGSDRVPSRVTLLDLIRRSVLDVGYLIAVTVPEYPYLLLTGFYRSWHNAQSLISLALEGDIIYRLASKIASIPTMEELNNELSRYRRDLSKLIDVKTRERLRLNIYSALFSEVLFLDEFHVWDFYEIPTIQALLVLYALNYELVGKEWRIILSSATPQEDFYELLSEAGLGEVSVVRAETVDIPHNAHRIKSRTVVEFVPINVECGALAWFRIEDRLPEVVEERGAWLCECGRSLLISRRNSTVERCAESFYKVTGKTPTIVTGVRPPSYAKGREELVAKKYVGDLYAFANYAADVGIDLKRVKCGVIHATHLGELVQRFGRIGRGDVDEAYVIIPVPKCYIDKLLSLGGKEVSYSELVSALSTIISKAPSIAEYESTFIRDHFIGKLRLYAPLAMYFLMNIALWEYPEEIRELSTRFLKLIDKFDLRSLFSQLPKVQKKAGVIVPLSSFRLTTSVGYRRDNEEGEASLTTLLMNYEVEYDLKNGKLVVREAARKRASEVLKLRTKYLGEFKHLDRSVMGSQTLLTYCLPQKVSGFGGRKDILYQVLLSKEIPVYVAVDCDHHLMELLNAYGYAVKVESSLVDRGTGKRGAAYLLFL